MKFDHYEVLCREDGSIFRLGQGNTSSSYKALDTKLRVPVVLKVVRPEFLEDETARKRFLREARAAALMRHPNVAQIYHLGDAEGACYYAREFIEGETLEAKVKREGPLRPVEALEVALQVAQALVAVKEAHLVHRDIKPSNVMMTPRGDIKIIDFGLTKSNPHGQIEGVEAITLSGFLGSPDYASPEQLNEAELDVTSDIYSLGVTLWFLLTGRGPFRGPQAVVMSQHMTAQPPFEELGNLPPAITSLLAHMLEKEPTKRPASPALLVTEIEHCLAVVGGRAAGPSPATFPPPVPGLPAAAAVPVAGKISANREPAGERSPRQFVLAELLVGTVIAIIIYLVLSRPVPAPSSVQNTDGRTPEVSESAYHAPLGARMLADNDETLAPVSNSPPTLSGTAGANSASARDVSKTRKPAPAERDASGR